MITCYTATYMYASIGITTTDVRITVSGGRPGGQMNLALASPHPLVAGLGYCM